MPEPIHKIYKREGSLNHENYLQRLYKKLNSILWIDSSMFSKALLFLSLHNIQERHKEVWHINTHSSRNSYGKQVGELLKAVSPLLLNASREGQHYFRTTCIWMHFTCMQTGTEIWIQPSEDCLIVTAKQQLRVGQAHCSVGNSFLSYWSFYHIVKEARFCYIYIYILMALDLNNAVWCCLFLAQNQVCISLTLFGGCLVLQFWGCFFYILLIVPSHFIGCCTRLGRLCCWFLWFNLYFSRSWASCYHLY